MSYDDYYPFGSIMPGSESTGYRSKAISGVDGRYKFTSKERDTETGWDYFGKRYYDPFIARWPSADPESKKYPDVSPYAYVFNNPMRYTDPNGDTVNVDPNLLKQVLDKNGNPIPYDKMTPEQQHRVDFQNWWKNNQNSVEKLFGVGGKYEETTINFNLGTMPYPTPSFSNLFNLFASPEQLYNAYDALTTFGTHGQDPGNFVRGREAISPLKMSVSNLVFNLWFNPNKHLVPQNAAYHEWKHVSIIFDRVKNNLIIPNGPEQHRLINRGEVPIIK